MQTSLPGIDAPDRVMVANMTMQERVERAIALLREHEPPEGYYEAFSGGKDSCTIDALAKMAGVKYEKHYSNTTIDPPELIRFIKREHADAIWTNPKHGNMFHRIATRPGLPPTRMVRWCCDEYKETHGAGRVKVFGVRAAESAKRKHRWSEVSFDTRTGAKALCPIVYWSDDDVWEFIRATGTPYCSLYDAGLKRLGCIGCPLAGTEGQDREFAIWPRYEELWRRAVISNWQNHQGKTRSIGGEYYHARFATGEDFWQWWRRNISATHGHDVFRADCQSGILWTNEDAPEDVADAAGERK